MKEDNYKNIIIKISGESLKENEDSFVINPLIISDYANQIMKLQKQNYNIGVVIGGGNIWRGQISEKLGIERVKADYMGMLATVINSLALAGSLETKKAKVKVINAFEIEHCGEVLNSKKYHSYFKEGYVLIFGGGTGKPYITTDTAAALRAIDIKSDLILAGKNGTDGIYDKDPNRFSDAIFISEISYKEAIEKQLAILDYQAMDLCQEYKINTYIFDVKEEDAFINALNNKQKKSILKFN